MTFSLQSAPWSTSCVIFRVWRRPSEVVMFACKAVNGGFWLKSPVFSFDPGSGSFHRSWWWWWCGSWLLVESCPNGYVHESKEAFLLLKYTGCEFMAGGSHDIYLGRDFLVSTFENFRCDRVGIVSMFISYYWMVGLAPWGICYYYYNCEVKTFICHLGTL